MNRFTYWEGAQRIQRCAILEEGVKKHTLIWAEIRAFFCGTCRIANPTTGNRNLVVMW